jgi:hypothetical protein
MTVFFPDISSYEAGLRIQPGTVAVIAKATEGTYYRDVQYANFKAQAAAVGAVFSAYHFLKAGGGAAQAEYCFAMVGSTPVMLDVETEGSSKPTVQDCLDFIVRMRQLGGRVWGAYFPRWFWEQVGGNLAELGVAIVASGYPGGYSDTDANWQPYGGVTPLIWQYTDSQPYGGQRVDFNAYRGSTAQLAALITGNGTTAPTQPNTGDTDMGTYQVSAGWQNDYSDVAAALQAHIPAGTVVDETQAAAYAMIRSFVAAERAGVIEVKLDQLLNRPAAAPAVDVNALAGALGPLLHPTTDANALAAALLPHLPGNPDPAAFATQLATHIKVV